MGGAAHGLGLLFGRSGAAVDGRGLAVGRRLHRLRQLQRGLAGVVHLQAVAVKGGIAAHPSRHLRITGSQCGIGGALEGVVERFGAGLAAGLGRLKGGLHIARGQCERLLGLDTQALKGSSYGVNRTFELLQAQVGIDDALFDLLHGEPPLLAESGELLLDRLQVGFVSSSLEHTGHRLAHQ